MNFDALREGGTGRSGYTRVAALLHWLIAGFILLNLSLGWFMKGFPPWLKFVVLPLHISAGITVFALTIFRVIWRLTHMPPPHVPPLGSLERHAAEIVHFLLYCGMLLMPLTGWAILSAHPASGTSGFAAAQTLPGPKAPPGGGGMKIWWSIPLPSLAPVQDVGATPGGLAPQKHLHDEFASWHSLGGWLMIFLLTLHLAGALKHEYVDCVPSLSRMRLHR